MYFQKWILRIHLLVFRISKKCSKLEVSGKLEASVSVSGKCSKLEASVEAQK